jgi:hypothetical protein
MIQYETKNPWDAERTEVFFNQSTNKLAYKDKLGIVHDLGSSVTEVQTLDLNVPGTINVVYTDGTDAYLWDVNTTTYVAIGTIGTSYIVVKGVGTEAENAIELQAAYDYATSATPYGNILGPDNKFTVLVYPGIYLFEDVFELNSSYVDVIAISTLKAEYTQSVIIPNGVSVTAGSINVKGISTMQSPFSVESDLGKILIENCSGGDYSFSPINYATYQGVLDSVFINCQGGTYSFGFYQNVVGTFENCTGRDYSFGSSDDNTVGVGYANGVFTNCSAGSYSFGVFGEAGGIFTNCVASAYSFGYACNATGLFINCSGKQYCFGAGSNELEILASASGSFTDCTADDYSFGYLNTASGSFIRCIGKTYCFGSDNNSDASGEFTDCIANAYSFGYKGVASGIFNRCSGEEYCFGSSDSTALISLCTGTFTNCLSNVGYSFGYLGSISAQAVFNNCTSLDYSFSAADYFPGYLDCNGTFNNCQARDNSFGFNSNLQRSAFNNCTAGAYSFCGGNSPTTGMTTNTTFNNCVASFYSFGELIGFSGKAYYCVGGNLSFGGGGGIDITGQIYYCRLTTGSFTSVTGTGVTRYCINADNTTDNQG